MHRTTEGFRDGLLDAQSEREGAVHLWQVSESGNFPNRQLSQSNLKSQIHIYSFVSSFQV